MAYSKTPAKAPKRDPYVCLPMIEQTPSDAKANFWAVKRTGDYAFDCALGEGLAGGVAKAIDREQLADTPRHIILSMVKRGKWTASR
jgi:hypothetical protein